MKVYWGSTGTDPLILNLGATWSRVVNFIPHPLPQGTIPGTLWVGGWSEPMLGLDGLEKKKSFVFRDSYQAGSQTHEHSGCSGLQCGCMYLHTFMYVI
jgi:hypothetical protein